MPDDRVQSLRLIGQPRTPPEQAAEHVANLEALLAAVHANEPKREIVVRVGNAIQEATALAQHMLQRQVPTL